VDNLDTGSLQNIEHIRADEFTFVNHDVTEHIEIDGPVDVIFHAASPASPIDYARLPLHTLKVGSYGTHNALGLAKFKRARILLFSTSEVYGDPQVHPQPETYWGNVNPIGPRGVYDEAKRYAEAMTMAYHRQQGVDTGDRPHLQHLRPAHAPARRPRDPDLPPPGAPGPADHRVRRRLPDALVLLRIRPHRRHHPPRRVRLPPAGQRRQSQRVHAARARQGRHRDHRVAFRHRARGPATDDPQVRQPDIALAREILGWEPQVELREGLRRTLDESGVETLTGAGLR
jgi:Nucleoside-diphosphate-sugar epimerases